MKAYPIGDEIEMYVQKYEKRSKDQMAKSNENSLNGTLKIISNWG